MSLNSSDATLGGREVAMAAALVAASILALWLMGRVPVCECGTIRLWFGGQFSNETSQQLTDWYSFSHVIHGFLFYGLTWLLFRRRSLGARLSLAIAVEAAWEIFENTTFIIDRYREQTISLDYYGDSLLNSFGDLMSMILGFLLASRLPLWLTISLALAMEIIVGALIRDNLTLNIIMLLWPVEIIRTWQAGG